MRPGARLQVPDERSDDGSSDEPPDHRDHDVDDHRQVDGEADPACDHGPTDELTGGADVEQARPERERDSQPREDERSGVDRRLRQRVEYRRGRASVEGGRHRVRVQDGAFEHRRVSRGGHVPCLRERGAGGGEHVAPGVQHNWARERDEQPSDDDRSDDREKRDHGRAAFQHGVQERDRHLGPLRTRSVRRLVVGAPWRESGATRRCRRVGRVLRLVSARAGMLLAHAGCVSATLPVVPAPAIKRPSSSIETVGSLSPAIRPSYMTTIRSASA